MNIDKVASIADIVLGAWLFLSMFLWRESPEDMVSTGVVGVLSVAFGTMAYRGYIWARWLVAALGVWLFASVWMLPRGSVGSVVNHLIIGTMLFGFSALPTGRGRAVGATPL
jgi:hypothetical protein